MGALSAAGLSDTKSDAPAGTADDNGFVREFVFHVRQFRHRHLPRQCGARFSTNAACPSLASSLASMRSAAS